MTNPEYPEISTEEALKARLSELLALEDKEYRSDFNQIIKIDGVPIGEFDCHELPDKMLSIHKLLFLTGGIDDDVVTARDQWGNYIYTKASKEEDADFKDPVFRNKYPLREGEIQEAKSSISSFIQRVKNINENPTPEEYQEIVMEKLLEPFDFPEVLSELADIFWNVQNINELDASYDYEPRLRSIARALGYSYEQALSLARTKYEQRLVVNKEKNIEAENEEFGRLVRGGQYEVPSLGQLTIAAGEINVLKSQVEHRLGMSEVEVMDIL